MVACAGPVAVGQMSAAAWLVGPAREVSQDASALRGHERNAVNRYSINELGDLPLATWLADLV